MRLSCSAIGFDDGDCVVTQIENYRLRYIYQGIIYSLKCFRTGKIIFFIQIQYKNIFVVFRVSQNTPVRLYVFIHLFTSKALY